MNRDRVKLATLGAICSGLFMTNLDETIMHMALPKIQSSLDSGVSGLQWVLNAYTLAEASLILIGGTLGDIYGRKRVFLIGLVIFTIASTVCGFAPNLGILIAGRTLQGIGAAVLIPGSLAILTHTFNQPKEKAKAIGMWSGISGLALIAGPVLGGLLVDSLGWQSVFFLNIPLGIIAFVVSSRFIGEVKNQTLQRLDIPGLVLSVILLTSISYTLTEGNAGGRSLHIIVQIGVIGVSLLAFLVVESRSSHSMLPLNLFKNSTFLVVNVVSILVFFTLASLLFIFSLFLQQIQGYSAIEAGLRFLPINGSFILASFVSGWLAARLGLRLLIAMGLMLAGLATLAFIGISPDTEYGAIWWKLALCGFGSGLTLAPLKTTAMSTAPPTQLGIASAVINTSDRIGSILGIALQGKILTQQLTSNLKRSLLAWGVPPDIQDRIVADALHSGTKLSTDLPASITSDALTQAISNAFVSGLNSIVFVAGIALISGAFLILAFVKSTFEK
ncbi:MULTISPECIES: MFS transporter [unclassified Nostoc]|uniref:MFS transporter n=1 Tax=unclassified Nostoc TaxID=2593658 RepID=UPI002AD28C49|nr:MFS transporter [Nostoc sp. DedQUE03]MDZ7975570.1 MFS transporter [Nostoc sp. DedQUE03]MDZ8048785.1 MFS transporter [Nostoc sp. DedQUE02]